MGRSRSDGKRRTARTFLPENRQGIAIDIIAIVANLILFPAATSRIDRLFNDSFGDNSKTFLTLAGLMAFILAARLGGLYLKRFPLQARLGGQERPTYFPIYLYLLNFGVFVLNAAFAVLLFTALAGQLGLVETRYDGSPKDSLVLNLAGVFLMVALIAVEAFLLYRLSKPLTEAEKARLAAGDWKYGWKGEFAADFGLFAYMMVWQVFYNNVAKLFMTPASGVPESAETRIVSTVFLFFAFLLFYLSPRTVFLIEDRKYLGTWVFIFGVFIASIVRYV